MGNVLVIEVHDAFHVYSLTTEILNNFRINNIGLLGVNGAGKTTTFRMLTGDEFRSSGNAYAFMNSLDKHQRAFFSNIGYCPQFDGIIGVLNGREMLQLFCRLRGIPGSHGRKEAEKWLHNFGIF